MTIPIRIRPGHVLGRHRTGSGTRVEGDAGAAAQGERKGVVSAAGADTGGRVVPAAAAQAVRGGASPGPPSSLTVSP